MLAVDRQQRRAGAGNGGGQHFACGDQRLLVGKRHGLALFYGGHGRGQPGAANDGGDGDVGLARGGFDQRRLASGSVDIGADEGGAQVGEFGLVGDNRHFGAEFAGECGKVSGIAIGGERDDAPVRRIAPDEVERRCADRAGGTEDGYGACGQKNFPIPPITPATNNTASSPSSRSNKPPWPGMRLPLSFTPARRFIQLSKKSPV